MRDSLTQPLCASNLVGTLSAESPVIQRTSNQLASANCHAVAPMDPVSVGRTSGFDEMCSTYALNSRFRVASRQGTLRPQRGGVMTLRVMLVRTVDRPIAPRDSGGQPDQPSVGVSSPPWLPLDLIQVPRT